MPSCLLNKRYEQDIQIYLRGGHNSNNFSLLDVYLDKKGPSVKIQLPNVFKDHHIVAQTSPTAVGYD